VSDGAARFAPPRLELIGICKSYPGVIANEAIDLSVYPGEIHAILGENGAGKSTLMKIIYGVSSPDAGFMRWNNRQVEVTSPAAARKLGIGMVFQHFTLFETLTVAENILLVMGKSIPMSKLVQDISRVSEEYGLPVDPNRLVHSMSMGERQRVEIIRCLLQKPELLIMDEPTSVLIPGAVRTLFQTLRRLACEGCSILYISHKLDEIRELCHHATVLRNGRVVGQAVLAEQSSDSLARLMIGKNLSTCQFRTSIAGEKMLKVRNLNLAAIDPFGTALENIHFFVRSGEILGIAGISGNGQKELLAVLSGETRIAKPKVIHIDGCPAGKMGPAERRRLGLSFVPEERLGRGAVPDMSLELNALLTTTHKHGLQRHGWIRFSAVRQFALQIIEQFGVKSYGLNASAASLSGGNLQKFIVGREILLAPRVMIAAQPTWGVDIGAATMIRQALLDLKSEGVAVLVISEELDELMTICDRITVIANGKLSPILPVSETSTEHLGRWMGGDFTTNAESNPHVEA